MNRALIIFVISGILFSGCEDLFEENISDDIVTLNFPEDGDTLSPGVHTFWWNPIDAATSYRLLILEGTTDHPTAVTLDSIVTSNQYQFSLGGGEYHWVVDAINHVSTTHSDTHTLTIDTIPQLQNESVIISSPSSGTCISDTLLEVSWLPSILPDVEYHVELRQGYFLEGQTISAYDTKTTSLTFSLPTALEGLHTIGIRVVNDVSSSAYSTVEFHTDRTPPANAKLTFPSNNYSTIDTSINFTWEALVDGVGCAETDSIIIYSDSLLTSIHSHAQLASRVQSYQTTLSLDTYWWTVKREDKAGNNSTDDELFKLEIIE